MYWGEEEEEKESLYRKLTFVQYYLESIFAYLRSHRLHGKQSYETSFRDEEIKFRELK